MIIAINQTTPVALVLDHPEIGTSVTAEIIGPWVEEGETIGQVLRFQGEPFERHLRHDEITALQEGTGEVGTEIRLKRRGSLYYYGRREFGLPAVTDQPISRERALQIYQANMADTADADGRIHTVGVVSFGSQACSWRWAVAYSEED
jgi:hypothetical protein